MNHVFRNGDSVPIGRDDPNQIESQIQVNNLTSNIRDVVVSFDIQHTYTNDLRITLISPQGTGVMLVEREGGSGNNFSGTTFDDAAVRSIIGADAPFSGSFRPESSLSAFDGEDPNGVWTLRVEDTAALDGGVLSLWKLVLDDGHVEFTNNRPEVISASGRNTVVSTIDATGMGGAVVEDVFVEVDLEHTWLNDLRLTLRSPADTSVTLIAQEGGSGDDLRNTVFDDSADASITDGAAPFAGRFRPEQPLAEFREEIVNGTWTLEVSDEANLDGGKLHSWTIGFHARSATPRRQTNFNIEVEFEGGLSAGQRDVFRLAASRWSEIIIGDLPAVSIDGRQIDDVLIMARGERIDGPNGILGQAGPTHIRTNTNLPARGVMLFDTDDLAQMEENGTLIDVIIHEMGHVLGLGTMWKEMKLVARSGSQDPVLTGARSMAQYAELLGAAEPTEVPIANTGGSGTREGHWREVTFGNELMTGFVGAAGNPLSRLTIACLEDMGYEVNFDAADAFELPNSRLMAAVMSSSRRCCHTTSHKPRTVDPD